MLHTLLVISVLSLIPVPCVLAREPVIVNTGQRVRVHVLQSPDHPIIGTVVRLEADSLVLDSSSGQEVVLPLDTVTGVEVSRGRKPIAGKGTLIGLVGGVVGGPLIVLATDGCGGGDDTISDETTCYACAVVLFGGAGALIGSIVGAVYKTEQWEAVELDRLRFSITPRRQGGVRFMVAVTLQ